MDIFIVFYGFISDSITCLKQLSYEDYILEWRTSSFLHFQNIVVDQMYIVFTWNLSIK